MFITNMLITDIVPMDKKRKRIILEDSSSFCLYNKEIKNLFQSVFSIVIFS